MKCMKGNEKGPEERWDQPNAQCLAWDYGIVKENHRFTFLHQGQMLDYAPATGKYSIWGMDYSVAGSCDIMPWPPQATGTLSSVNHKMLYVHGDQLLDYDANTGAYRVGNCDRLHWKDTKHLHCDTVNQGEWPSLRGGHELVYVGSDVILDWDPLSGAYKLWDWYRGVTSQTHQPTDDHSRAHGVWPSLVGAELTYLDKELMLSYDRLSGGYKLFKFDRKVTGEVDPFSGDPLAEGYGLPRKVKYVYGGNDTLLELKPEQGSYRVFKCRRNADEDEPPAAPPEGTQILFEGS